MSKNNTDFFKEKNSWSEIKDNLLGGYLPQYFQKVLKTGKPIFYVDCFAGKGKFEDGKNGSPLIAIEIREKALSRSTISDKEGALNTCFIDVNYANDLKNNIENVNYSYGIPQIISGKYEEKITEILREHSRENVFLYIDPYGIKSLESYLFDSFDNMGFNTFEMLINFNSFGFLRDACRVMKVNYQQDDAFQDLDELVEFDPTVFDSSQKSINLLTSIAGGEYWKGIVKDFKENKINGYQAERRLSLEYKQRLKKKNKYVLDMPIRLKPNQHPKYRMIHVSNHEDGCFLMAQNMQNRSDELYINIQQGGQLSIFDIYKGINVPTRTTEGDYITQNEIKQKIIEALNNYNEDIRLTKFISNFVNENGILCSFKIIHELLEELNKEGVIRIIRYPELTGVKKTPSKFWEEKKGQIVIIRKL